MNYSFFAWPPQNTLSKIAKQKPTRVLVSNLVKKYIIGFFFLLTSQLMEKFSFPETQRRVQESYSR